VLDRLATQKKEKHKRPKALAHEVQKTAFQEELEKNPYGTLCEC